MDKLEILEQVYSFLTFKIDYSNGRNREKFENARLEVMKLYRKYKEEKEIELKKDKGEQL